MDHRRIHNVYDYSNLIRETFPIFYSKIRYTVVYLHKVEYQYHQYADGSYISNNNVMVGRYPCTKQIQYSPIFVKQNYVNRTLYQNNSYDRAIY